MILTRQTTNHTAVPGTIVRTVDYNDPASLIPALQDIDTLISVLLIPNPDEMLTQHLNLLHAAISAGVKRFAPSEFALPPSSQTDIDFDNAKLAVWDAVRGAVAAGKIDAARFPSGMWMNYLGIGCRYAREEALAGFAEGPFLVHLADEDAGRWIEVPVRVDGTYPRITMTDLRDIGRFIAAAVEMEEPWSGRTLGMAGDTVGMGELVGLCERYVGPDLEVREVTEVQLRERLDELSVEDVLGRMECQIALVGCRDGLVVPPRMNELCSVQPTTIREFLERHWASGTE